MFARDSSRRSMQTEKETAEVRGKGGWGGLGGLGPFNIINSGKCQYIALRNLSLINHKTISPCQAETSTASSVLSPFIQTINSDDVDYLRPDCASSLSAPLPGQAAMTHRLDTAHLGLTPLASPSGEVGLLILFFSIAPPSS